MLGCRLAAWAYVVAVGFGLYAPVVMGLCGMCLSRNLGYSCNCAPYTLCSLLDAGHHSLSI